jgi:hypothetical protein
MFLACSTPAGFNQTENVHEMCRRSAFYVEQHMVQSSSKLHSMTFVICAFSSKVGLSPFPIFIPLFTMSKA